MKVGVIIPIEEWWGGGVDPVLPWSLIKELAQFCPPTPRALARLASGLAAYRGG